MMFVSSVLELIGVILLGIPPIRLLQANMRVASFSRSIGSDHPEAIEAIKTTELGEIVWPSRFDIIAAVSGLSLCCGAILIKIFHYGLEAFM